MPCTSLSSRHFVSPPALVSDPFLGVLVVRIAPYRARPTLASGDNTSNVGHADPIIV
jgi:hypothetical protein